MNAKKRMCIRAAPAILLLVCATAPAAAIFPKVTNFNNSGAGSLRAAITAANANGKGGAIVSFQIGSTCGPHVIHLATALSDLTAEVHIEGYSQPGSSRNTLEHTLGNDAAICIVIDGDNMIDDAFTVPASVATSMTMSVQGIAFSGFTHAAINLRGGEGHVVAGIRTGGTLNGVHLESNSYGVILAAGVHNATIGGPDNSQVNQFGDIKHNAIYLASSTASKSGANGNDLLNDNVGFVFNAKQQRVVLPTGGAAIAVGGSHNVLWRVDLENADLSGLHLSNRDAHDNRFYASISANNAGDGVLIDDDAYYNELDQNEISDNGGAGVRVINGQGNSIQFNQMADNAGLGIDLASAGATPNDNDSMQPSPDYANRGLNSPVLASAGGGDISGGVSGSLTTVQGHYYIDVYGSSDCDASGPKDTYWLPFGDNQESDVFVGAPTMQGQSTVSFTRAITFSTMPKFITATTSDTYGNTSEFSACVPYVR
ncbi:MAG: right-handed parallel beta-helix repeat-containing protein [Rudaea sp.]